MDDQIEKWRAEFKSIIKKENPLLPTTMLPDNSDFSDRDVWYLFKGFCMAKRSQKAVELPKPTEQQIYRWFQESTIAHHIAEDGSHIKMRAAFLAEKAIEFAISSVSIPYTVKGE